MGPRASRVLVVVVCGCGRLGFGAHDARVGDGAPVDLARSDAPPDAFALPGLIARYPLDDDPATGTLIDTVAGHDALCAIGATCPVSAAGHLGKAVQFDGATQFARVTFGAWLMTPSAYTYAAWIYVDSIADQVAFARPFGSGSDDIVDIVAWGNATGTCMESIGSAGTNESACGPMLPAGQWFHVAGRWTGTLKAIFVGGVKVGEIASTVSMMDASDLLIGSDQNSGSPAYFWHGKVDELELYDRALSDAEITTLAAQ